MNCLVTGGAGFIGRWTVKKLLEDGNKVTVFDNLSNGKEENLSEFFNHELYKGLTKGDIKDNHILETIFKDRFDICYHLAASINVQGSIDDPITTFNNDVIGTFNVLEHCRTSGTKMVFISTCMVYDKAENDSGISEDHPVKPASPYAGSKIAGENMVLSYWYAYGLPVVVIRPFNTYGPYQKSGGEGGVVPIFIKNLLEGKQLIIYGNGTQTRDLLYVEDCADFIVKSGYSDSVNGQIVNAGLGIDISINDLALLISKDRGLISHVSHIHPQSEIPRLLSNNFKAERLLGWKPRTSLERGIEIVKEWIIKFT